MFDEADIPEPNAGGGGGGPGGRGAIIGPNGDDAAAAAAAAAAANSPPGYPAELGPAGPSCMPVAAAACWSTYAAKMGSPQGHVKVIFCLLSFIRRF